MADYTIPAQTRIGHVHLKVSNMQRSLDFYCGVMGFELMQKYGSQAAFVSAGGYHHHIGLNTWYSLGQPPGNVDAPGLFHVAILYPGRRELAKIYKQLLKHGHPIIGASDHGVSVSLYLNDPDENGLELYYDRPESEWPRNADGSLNMQTKGLDLKALESEE